MKNKDKNKCAWNASKFHRNYSGQFSLLDPEAILFELIARNSTNIRTLDLGVGYGRTTGHLLKISEQYIGIDYSEPYINSARDRFQTIDFRLQDVRDGLDFPDDYFDLVLFSNNGIDYMTHSERLYVLTNINRILKSGGVLIFSSHNLHYDFKLSQSNRRTYYSWNPIKFIQATLETLCGMVNRWVNKRDEIYESTYAVLNDSNHNFKFLTYYIDKNNQIDQLRSRGFENVKMLDIDGREINSKQEEVVTPWIYYSAVKAS